MGREWPDAALAGVGVAPGVEWGQMGNGRGGWLRVERKDHPWGREEDGGVPDRITPSRWIPLAPGILRTSHTVCCVPSRRYWSSTDGFGCRLQRASSFFHSAYGVDVERGR